MSDASQNQVLFHRNVSFSVGPETNGVRPWIIFPADGPPEGGGRGVAVNTRGDSFRNAVQDAQTAIDNWLDRPSRHSENCIAPQPHPEIARARLLVARSRLLVQAAKAQHSAVIDKIVRAKNLVQIASELSSVEVQDTLMAFPQDGSWMPGAGPYSKTINDMLDGASLLIEEDNTVSDDEAPWRVRLTEEAIQLLA